MFPKIGEAILKVTINCYEVIWIEELMKEVNIYFLTYSINLVAIKSLSVLFLNDHYQPSHNLFIIIIFNEDFLFLLITATYIQIILIYTEIRLHCVETNCLIYQTMMQDQHETISKTNFSYCTQEILLNIYFIEQSKKIIFRFTF